MMKCKHCGAGLKEGARFCPKCGKPTASQGNAVGRFQVEAPAPSPKPPKRGKGGLIALLIVLILLICAGAGGAVYYKLVWQPAHEENDRDSQKEEEDEETPEETRVPETRETVKESVAETTVPAVTTTAAETTAAAQLPHSYELIVKDCTWNEAYAEAKGRGGYLVHIDSEEEYQLLLKGILATDQAQNLKLWIGGTRAADGREYHWANADGTFGTATLNGPEYAQLWMTNEPSFRDEGIQQDECYMNIFYYDKEGRWVWNDVPDDIIGAVSSYAGSVGYICEYE